MRGRDRRQVRLCTLRSSRSSPWPTRGHLRTNACSLRRRQAARAGISRITFVRAALKRATDPARVGAGGSRPRRGVARRCFASTLPARRGGFRRGVQHRPREPDAVARRLYMEEPEPMLVLLGHPYTPGALPHDFAGPHPSHMPVEQCDASETAAPASAAGDSRTRHHREPAKESSYVSLLAIASVQFTRNVTPALWSEEDEEDPSTMALPPPAADNLAAPLAFLPGPSCEASAPPKSRSYSGRKHSEAKSRI
jgi:hypothetical protein